MTGIRNYKSCDVILTCGNMLGGLLSQSHFVPFVLASTYLHSIANTKLATAVISRIFYLFSKLDEIAIELYDVLHPLYHSLPNEIEEVDALKEFKALIGNLPQVLSAKK